MYRKIKSLRFVLFLILASVLNLCFLNANIYAQSETTNNNSANEESLFSTDDLQRLAIVIASVKKYYYKSIDNKTLFDHAISGMLAGLDPHSAYLNAEDLQELEMETVGKFGGIGIEIMPDQGLIKIVSPIDDAPADKAGIKAGDYIIKINDQFVKDMNLHDALLLMRGPTGSKIVLTIWRKGEPKPLVFSVKREIIKMQPIKGKLLDKYYGYVRISLFQEQTESELNKAVEQIRKEANGELKGLILDLRNNPGGLLESAVQIADDFLDPDKIKYNGLIVYTKGQSNEIQVTARATPGDIIPGLPMVVLVNEGSASASEIVAGALQDYKRALIVGTKTFGKGSVQTLIPIDNSTAIKLTTSLYFTPAGRKIQAVGIEPDIVAENLQVSKKGAEEAAEYEPIRESSLAAHIGGDETAAESTAEQDSWVSEYKPKTQKEKVLAQDDHQLYEALQILKSLAMPRYKEI